MNSNRPANDRHLDDDAIQALLDIREESGEHVAGPVREHLAHCARCRSQVEAWREVFRELGELGRIAPPGRFAERVMAAVQPQAAGRPATVWGWSRVRRWFARPAAVRHLTGRRLQDLADGALSLPRAARAKAHLAACERCEGRFAGWRRLVATLESLPCLGPPSGFADAVMARWHRMAEERAVRSQARRGWALWPRSPRGWAVTGALLGVPAAAMSGLAVFVSSFPQLTAGGLISYLSWQATDALSGLGNSLLGGLMQSGAAFRAYAVADFMLTSPGITAAGAAAFTSLTLAATWVLHRNLVFTHAAPRHVHT